MGRSLAALARPLGCCLRAVFAHGRQDPYGYIWWLSRLSGRRLSVSDSGTSSRRGFDWVSMRLTRQRTSSIWPLCPHDLLFGKGREHQPLILGGTGKSPMEAMVSEMHRVDDGDFRIPSLEVIVRQAHPDQPSLGAWQHGRPPTSAFPGFVLICFCCRSIIRGRMSSSRLGSAFRNPINRTWSRVRSEEHTRDKRNRSNKSVSCTKVYIP
ncbi:hypothetical protein BJ166DRAFT_84362 [Pestalotiopsis sp. NC0098]|nr:hypothetical protein BJ166DRAFT_84362 [Pestalotiopsis sp. NC0098]